MVTLPAECQNALKSKENIDRIGDLLVKSPISNEALESARCYRIFRVMALENCVRKVRDANLPNNSLLSARLKRLVSIRRKLERSALRGNPTRLSRMDDVIGIRVVCDHFSEAIDFSSRLEKTSHRIKNYVEDPKATGYRAIHHILRIEQHLPSNPNVDASFTFEVQVRTFHQNQWGIWSESFGEQVKENCASETVANHLLRLSREIESWEDGHKNKRQDHLPALSENYSLALVKRIPGLSSHFFQYGIDAWSEALKLLFYWEKSAQGDSDVLLLAGSGRSESIKKSLQLTHPTFFRTVTAPISIETNGYLIPKWS